MSPPLARAPFQLQKCRVSPFSNMLPSRTFEFFEALFMSPASGLCDDHRSIVHPTRHVPSPRPSTPLPLVWDPSTSYLRSPTTQPFSRATAQSDYAAVQTTEPGCAAAQSSPTTPAPVSNSPPHTSTHPTPFVLWAAPGTAFAAKRP